jgi:hypothetical protein
MNAFLRLTHFDHRSGLDVKSILLAVVSIALLSWPSTLSAQKTQNWPPITASDLVLPDPTLDPQAPAVILDYQIFTDNTYTVYFTENHYERIKILREEGRKYANVEIRYIEWFDKVEEIHARVTSPDAHSTEFNGTIYDNEIFTTSKYRVSSKTFTLPDVQVGSIIEYSYRLRQPNGLPPYFAKPAAYKLEGTYAVAAAEWTVQQDLFVRHAKFVLVPSRYAVHLSTYLQNISAEALHRNPKDNSIQLEVNNIPAFQQEEFSGPEENLKTRADLFYTMGETQPYQVFWDSLAKREAKEFEVFAGKPKDIEHEAAGLVASGDSDEAKLRKIYARVQQIRNLTFETAKTKKELKEESLKENKTLVDLLSRGYGNHWEINYAFIALARAAGFRAFPVRIATRDNVLFTAQRFDVKQLNSDIAEVRLGSTKVYLDPGIRYCPFGLLPWAETGATGIRLDPVEGGMVSTPAPGSAETVERLQANLKLDAEGNLEGKLAVVFHGQQALSFRIEALQLDESGRQKLLEDVVERSLQRGSTAKLVSADGWQATDAPLKAEFELHFPNYDVRTGQRVVLPLGVMQSALRGSFTSTRRVNAVYFDYPFERYDDITLELPSGYTVESLPAAQSTEREGGQYRIGAEVVDNTIRVQRSFKQTKYYFPAASYSSLRSFYDLVRSGDEQQATLKSAISGSP